MKFSHSLQFNAVPEWSSKYIAYTTLKKLIYSLQRDQVRYSSTGEDDEENSHLISNDHRNLRDPVTVFTAALDAELNKIDEFYEYQQEYVYKNIDELVVDIENFEKDLSGRRSGDFGDFSLGQTRSHPGQNQSQNQGQAHTTSSSNHPYSGSAAVNSKAMGNFENTVTDPDTEFTQDEDTQEDIGALKKSKSIDDYLKSPKSPGLWENENENIPPQLLLLTENRILLRKRVIGLFTTLSELKSFIELNYTGFEKALKKFDKSVNTNLKDQYLDNLPNRSFIFKDSTINQLNDKIDSLIKLYQLICNHPDFESAKSELSVHLREHVVWERNTVWRDMIGLERKTYAANVEGNNNGGLNNKSGNMTDGENDKSGKLGNGKLNSIDLSFTNPVFLKLLIISLITIILINIKLFEEQVQTKCFAILICASLLWATEAIPLFVTSLLIPLLIITLKVLKNDDGSTMSSTQSSKFILSSMWNSVILLLLGGFTLAAALSKYNIAKLISTTILSKAGTNPSTVLITIMGIALFASMWVSNVAAPVLCFSLIQPLLRTLPKDSKFKNALILGIALASNIGGMASPIASPQNMIAIESMEPQPSWGQWFVISIPICIISLILIWLFLLITFNCNSKNTKIISIRTSNEKFSFIQWYIIFISILTIILWCVASKLEFLFGEMGIISLLPIILFFGGGLLTTEDFNNYPWNIVILAMGGTALGKAVSSSGLLSTIAISIQHQVEDFSLFGVAVTFGLLILIMATFVSHTVAAIITVPLVSEIGSKMSEPHPRLLIMLTALLCSSAMGLPTSGFPNVTAICMTDEFGKPYLTVGTFITRGVPSSLIAYFVIITIGYATMKLINF